MSTNIGNGLILKTQNISDLFKILNKLNLDVKNCAFELALKDVAEDFTDFYDNKTDAKKIIKKYALKNSKEKLNFKFKLIDILIDQYNYNSNEIIKYDLNNEDQKFDYRLILNIYNSPKAILIIPYYKKNEYYDILTKYFLKYHYWNNSDKDDFVSDKEWENRNNIWNKALDDEKIRYDVFLNYNNIIDFHKCGKNEICQKIYQNIPNIKSRAYNISLFKNREIIYNNLYIKNFNNKTAISSWVYDYFELTSNKEFENKVIENSKEIVKDLKEISFEDFVNYKITENIFGFNYDI